MHAKLAARDIICHHTLLIFLHHHRILLSALGNTSPSSRRFAAWSASWLVDCLVVLCSTYNLTLCSALHQSCTCTHSRFTDALPKGPGVKAAIVKGEGDLHAIVEYSRFQCAELRWCWLIVVLPVVVRQMTDISNSIYIQTLWSVLAPYM